MKIQNHNLIGGKTQEKEYVFSNETIDSLNKLGSVLGRIRKRLLAERYIIKDNKIFKPL